MARGASTMLIAAEQSTLAALLDRLIPPDETGPGAVEAGVQRYVESALAGAYATSLGAYQSGLTAVEEIARDAEGDSFATLDMAAQDAVVAALESHDDPAMRQFFELVRMHAIEGMFGDPCHGGNVGHAGWALIGFPGPKGTYAEADQALGAIVEAIWQEQGRA